MKYSALVFFVGRRKQQSWQGATFLKKPCKWRQAVISCTNHALRVE